MTINESTSQFAVEFRLFIGPPWKRSDDAAFWDWSALTTGSYTPTPSDTTINGDLEPTVTSVVLTYGTLFPAKGGVWIGPNGTNENWEYCTYTGRIAGTLSGLTRELVTQEQSGHHTDGATVYFWFPVEIVDPLEITEELDDNFASNYWTIRIRGEHVVQAALRNGNLALLQARWIDGANASWGNWQNEFIGWLQQPKFKDDVNQNGEWEATIVSTRGMLNRTKVRGVRIGSINDAKSGKATGSTALGGWYKEAHSAEMPTWSTKTGPDQAIDDNPSTPYISEAYLYPTSLPVNLGIEAVHIAPYIGQGRGYRWIQFRVTKDKYNTTALVRNASNVYPELRDFSSSRVVLVENRAAFQDENPDVGSEWDVVEFTSGWPVGQYAMSESGCTIGKWWDSLSPSGGGLHVEHGKPGRGFFAEDYVLWGTQAKPSGWTWSGANVTVPSAGQTIQHVTVDQNIATAYQVNYIAMPGKPWEPANDTYYLMVQRPSMNLTVAQNITAGSPGAGENLYVALGDTLSVDGLSTSGTLQISSEQLTYTAKTATQNAVVVGARGANSTAATTHQAGEPIYQVESGLATDNAPLDAVQWRRPTGKPVPANFSVYGCRSITQPQTPPTGYWTDSWTSLFSVSNYSGSIYTSASVPAPNRYKWVMMVVDKMSGNDPYRMMVNEFRTYAGSTVFGNHLNSGTIADTASLLLSNGGFPGGAFSASAGLTTTYNYTTDTGFAGQVCADLADFGNCRFDVGRDSKVNIYADPYWSAPAYDLPATQVSWNVLNVTSIDADYKPGTEVGQVQLSWRAPDSATVNTVYYPSTLTGLGQTVKLGPYILVDTNAANDKARKEYWKRRSPYGVLVEANGAPFSYRAGQMCELHLSASDASVVVHRNYVIQQAQYQIEENKLQATFTVLQVGKEDET
jgi:hypothetical protein